MLSLLLSFSTHAATIDEDIDTIYVDLEDYGTIQIGHGRTTWLRLYS